MPKPLPKAGLQMSGSSYIGASDAAACLAGIGQVAIGWTGVERALWRSLSEIFGSTERAGISGTIHYNRVVKEAIRQSETIRVRLKIADALLSEKLRDTKLATQWDDLKRNLNGRSRERNKIVHGEWLYSSDHPGHIILSTDRLENYRLWQAKDFRDVSDRFHLVELALMRFTDEVVSAIKSGEIGADDTAQKPDNPRQIWITVDQEIRLVDNPDYRADDA